MQKVILYGGGLDSTALLPYLRAEGQYFGDVTMVHVDYGQKAVLKEREAAKYFSDKYQCGLVLLSMDMSFSKATIMKNTDIGTADTNRLELRNVALISYVASYAASTYHESEILVGFHLEPFGSGFLDAKTDYLECLEKAIQLATNQTVQLNAPFCTATRKEILDYANGLDKDVVIKSYTCYEPEECGKCTHCTEKTQMIKDLK